jgi:nucleoside-diphosphate-sugar epimerase
MIPSQALQTNNTVIRESETLGVKSYIFAPCIVYGRGEGFGNKVSIQTVAVVKAAKALRRVYKPLPANPIWPVCHVYDNATLYLQMLRQILSGVQIGHGRNGYYLASPGAVPWNELYAAMAKQMHKKGVVESAELEEADEEVKKRMGEALGCDVGYMIAQLSGCCTFTPRHGNEIGWMPKYNAEHILETAGEEVELILDNI